MPERATRPEHPERDTARDAPVGEHEQVAVEPREPWEQLGVARVVVVPKPDAHEEDPIGCGSGSRDEPAKRQALHGAPV